MRFLTRFLLFLVFIVVPFFAVIAIAQAQTLPPLAPELQAIVDCEDPAFPPQSPSGQCATYIPYVGDGAGNDSRWNCTQPLPNYGPMPIIVNHIEPNAGTNPPGAIALGNTPGSYPATGCTVPSQRVAGTLPTCNFDGKADLFLQINGNRGNLGSNNDLVKTFGAHCIEIGDPTHSGGKWTAGQVSNGAHQDGHNCNYCRGLHYYGIEIGDWVAQESGAHGAGGLSYNDWLDVPATTQAPFHHEDIVCYECIFVGSGNTAQGEEHPGQPDGTGGAGLSFGESNSSGMVDSCIAHRRPLIFYATSANGSNQIYQGNTFVDRDTDVQADWDACSLVGDDPPPPPPPPLAQCEDGVDNDGDTLVDLADPGCESASDDDEFNEPPPPPPDPEPVPCDEACVAAYETQIASCRNKLIRINNNFHSTLGNARKLSRIHAIFHEAGACAFTENR